ncbi:HAD family hydrolase [Vibrio mediterranei]|uniref:HAD family hydrolase n=1 Tax=Vibrio mediterranei TaxID=689 RepID=UPI004067712E
MTIEAVVFDLDNTLVSSDLNFKQLRVELRCPEDKDLLLHVDEQPCTHEKSRLNALILKHELDDARVSNTMEGAVDLLRWLSHKGIRSGIVTRNCRQAATAKLKAHNLNVQELITREDFPAKPDPSSLYYLMEKWRIPRQRVLYVGDHHYDILTAKNAGCMSCFISNNQVSQNSFDADLFYSSLKGLLDYLEQL